jgi:hypothetical protein
MLVVTRTVEATMRILRLVATGTAVLIVGGCDGSGWGAPAPNAPTAAVRSPDLAVANNGPVEASGVFDAIVDFRTITFTPRGANCLLTVKGMLVFHGTIEGPATGQTDALVFATCDEVARKPAGTDPDVFHSKLVFEGTVAGQPATANVMYQGRSAAGGHIDGHLIFSNGVSGVLDASAQVAVGGEYSGSVVVQ